MNREHRRELRRDIKRRKESLRMLAREKWQIKTIAVLEKVFEERCRQMEQHGTSMEDLPDGTGPDVKWLEGVNSSADATRIQEWFREDYDSKRATPGGEYGQLTRMHLVREELAEMFECDPDSPEFIQEALQVAALCVQWVEYKS